MVENPFNERYDISSQHNNSLPQQNTTDSNQFEINNHTNQPNSVIITNKSNQNNLQLANELKIFNELDQQEIKSETSETSNKT